MIPAGKVDGLDMITINGKTHTDKAGMTLTQLVKTLGYHYDTAVVKLNGQLIKKSKFNETVTQDGDTIKIFSFLGGG